MWEEVRHGKYITKLYPHEIAQWSHVTSKIIASCCSLALGRSVTAVVIPENVIIIVVTHLNNIFTD